MLHFTDRSARSRILRNDPQVKWGADILRFRLTYQGLLLSESTKGSLRSARATHKQEIRKHFHKQLKRLWETNPALASAGTGKSEKWVIFGTLSSANSVDGLAWRFELGDYNFVPLITDNLDVLCNIDVLYLSNYPPGSVFKSGDIDNRLKTLFDALTMPKDKLQLGDYVSPEEEEKPFFCLLEDDSLITKASVETDTLLSPVSTLPDSNDARVIITVETKLAHVKFDNIAFA